MKCLAICAHYSVDVLITYKERTFVEHFATYLAFFKVFDGFLCCFQKINTIYNWEIKKEELKMLSLYLYTLIIGHKSVNMLRILNKLTLKKELQNFVTNKVFLNKK